MSGIFGFFNLDGRPAKPEIINRMKTSLTHLGGDDSGIWIQENVTLGHVMLHVTPESLHETVPLSEKTGRRVITSNARLDNREELCAKLDLDNSLRFNIADSELILKAYEKRGRVCPEHLSGDFVIVIWDGIEKELI